MQEEILNTLNDLAKNTADAFKSLGEINSKAVEKALEHQLNAANLYMEGTLAQVRLAQETKNVADYKDYLLKQTELAKAYGEKFQNVAKENVALAQEIGTEYKAWIEKGVRDFDDQTNSKTKTVAKKTA